MEILSVVTDQIAVLPCSQRCFSSVVSLLSAVEIDWVSWCFCLIDCKLTQYRVSHTFASHTLFSVQNTND